MRLFDLSLRFKGFKINEARRVLAQIKEQLNENPEEYIFSKQQEILEFHKKENAFYQEFTKGLNLQNWNDVPIMTKRDLQRPLSLRLSQGFAINSVYINKTSGSSGDPFIFAKDKWTHALTWAVIMDRFNWYDIDFNSSKQARFYGIPLDKKGYYKERLKDLLSHRFRFSVFDLSDEAFEKCVLKFQTTSFEYINGYTSSIVQFAKYLRKHNRILTSICPTLKVCMVTSEMLFEDDKCLMEEQFGVPVVNEYGASELDLIAFQNPDGDFQINNETLLVEVVDEKGCSVPNGTEGRIVITSLYNKAHPFIRYDIGDTGVLSEKSTLKNPILQKLVGRTNDIAILPSGKRAAGLTFYYITKSIIEDDGIVKEFIIEQLSSSKFKITYVSSESLSSNKILTIKKEMENYLESGIDITFERKAKLDRTQSGKLKQFTSYINASE